MNPLDALLAAGAALRLTRFVTVDDVPGNWWVREPLTTRAARTLTTTGREPSWYRYVEHGTVCPHCVGAHTSGWVLSTYLLTRGNPAARGVWRAVCGWLTLAYVTGHTAARLGDHP